MMKAVRGDVAHVVHRLESFSDIVIGFALAQTALSLVIPTKPVEFYTNPLGITAYVTTFILVARFWWNHAEIFRHYFEPTRIAVFLNFAALAALGIFVFSLQVWLHPNQSVHEQDLAAKGYFLAYALTYALLAVLRLVGVRARREHLTAELRRHGVMLSIRALCISLGVAGGAFLAPPTGLGQGYFYVGVPIAAVPLNIVIGAVAGALLSRIVRLILWKRDWGTPEKA